MVVSYYILLYSIVLYYIILCSSISYYIILYYIAFICLYCIILYYIVLYLYIIHYSRDTSCFHHGVSYPAKTNLLFSLGMTMFLHEHSKRLSCTRNNPLDSPVGLLKYPRVSHYFSANQSSPADSWWPHVGPHWKLSPVGRGVLSNFGTSESPIFHGQIKYHWLIFIGPLPSGYLTVRHGSHGP